MLVLEEANKLEVKARSPTRKERSNVIHVINLVIIPMNVGTITRSKRTRKMIKHIWHKMKAILTQSVYY